ncbi:MAG: hypothetical protein HQK89_03115 [Nitrospirae bacterium]|nr:hypothetical protein [Nitrospirota bacterium]
MIDNTVLHKINDAFIKIGYEPGLIKPDYRFADLFSSNVTDRTVDVAIFGQEPPDYRSACFGIQAARKDHSSFELARELKAFGAPQVFIVLNGVTEQWAVTDKDPVRKMKLKTVDLTEFIIRHESEWAPKTIIRAKSGFAKPSSRQLDFVDIGLLPALENQAAVKIDYLLRDILNNAENRMKDSLLFDTSKERIAAVFRVVFRLLAAKLFKERDIKGFSNVDFSSPYDALGAVSNHYGSSLPSGALKFPDEILKDIWREICGIFYLRNISVDTLAYIYENTFVTPENRKEFGIHSTPSYVADYVLSQIPFEELPDPSVELTAAQWNTTDLTSGQGIFLIAAMRRMRDFLPQYWNGQQRHEFFVSHLHGIEIDLFSTEVARMCLMLADFPESNGWHLDNADVFEGRNLENAAANTMILVGNPPFENIKGRRPKTPFPAELLRRSLPLLPAESLIGMVLPRSFVIGDDYKKERKMLLDDFELISITDLPYRIFQHSDMETTVIVARKHEPRSNGFVVNRKVENRDRESFSIRHQVTWEDKVQQSYFNDKMNGQLLVPWPREVWEYLEHYRKLGEVSDIKKGVQYVPNLGKEKLREIVRNESFDGSVPGIYHITKGFYQFVARKTVYMSTDENIRRRKAWNLDWAKPKIVIPAAIMLRGPWRYAAIIDNEGRFVSHRFFALWPKPGTLTVEVLAALLNSPVAEAFTYTRTLERDLTKRVYENIPIPEISSDSGQIIHSLVRDYLTAVESFEAVPKTSGKTHSLDLLNDESEAKKILLRIDAEILKLYKLPPRLERKVLDIFWGPQRHVPFKFTGYIPPEDESWIPLHIYISDRFRDATPEKLMERMPVIHDKALLDYLISLGRESE